MLFRLGHTNAHDSGRSIRHQQRLLRTARQVRHENGRVGRRKFGDIVQGVAVRGHFGNHPLQQGKMFLLLFSSASEA